jgi:hypothetical protein
VTANGWDSDGAADPLPDDNPLADSTPPMPDPAAGQGGYAFTPAPGPTDPIVPGMAVRSPALDYVLGQQRRRLRKAGTIAAAVLAIGIVVGVITVAAHNGGGTKPSADQLAAKQVVEQAARQQLALNTESATINESISGATDATISGTVELQRKPLLMDMNMKLAGASSGESAALGAILTRSAMYVRVSGMPGIPAALATKWLQIPLTGVSQSSEFGELQRELQDENPTSQFAGITAATHLQAAGSQIISGVTTTRYTGWFAPSAAIKSLPAAERGVLGPGLKLVKGNVSFSVWIDGNHFVRKIQETESVAGETILIECTYGSFNQPVKIALPPPSQIYAPPASIFND